MAGNKPNSGPSSNQGQQYSYQQQTESKPIGPSEQFPQQHQQNSTNYHLQPQPQYQSQHVLQNQPQQLQPPLEQLIQTYHPQQPSTTTPNTTNVQYIRQFLYQVNPNYSATLKFVKDLELMTKNWSESEIKSNRRLVKFEFTTENYVQVIDFYPISNSDYDNFKPTISCIYWKEMNSYVVTSVDIILLLEYLVNQTFDVEEKNRIRRNLQSLKPNTISRANIKDRNFFNLIMSMENPRPRNIEKDLKVFNWSDLRKAISKVMSKYYVVLANESTNNPQQQQPPQPSSWSTSSTSGVYPPQQHQALQSPHALQSPSSSLPSSVPTPFQYTPIQQHFPEFQPQQSPGYFPRHASLPNVMLISSINTTTFPSKDLYSNFNKIKAFDQHQSQFPPPPTPPHPPQHLMNHSDITPHQQYQQTRHNSQPFILNHTQFNSPWPVRKNSLPQSFHSNFYITHQQHHQHQQQQPLHQQQQSRHGQSQPSPRSYNINTNNLDSKSMSPITSGDNTPPTNIQFNDQILKRPLEVSSSSLSNKISSMLNKSPPINDIKSSINNNSNDLQNSKLDNLSNQVSVKNNITRVDLNDLITRDGLIDKLNNGIIVNEKSNNNNESSGNSTRLPSIAQLLNRNHSQDGTNKGSATINSEKQGEDNEKVVEEEEVEDNDLPLIKKQKNSSSD